MKRKGLFAVLVLLVGLGFFGCSDSDDGGGDPPREETAFYMSSDKTEVLKLTWIVAAQKSPARKAPASGTSGEYTLTIAGKLKSEGDFTLNGTSLSFKSVKDKIFTAELAISGTLTIPTEIELDDETKHTPKEMTETETEADKVPKSIRITGIPNEITEVGVNLMASFEAGNPTAMIFVGDVEGGVVEEGFLIPVGDQVEPDSEEWTGTGTFIVAIVDFTSGEAGDFFVLENVAITDALTELDFDDCEPYEE